MDRNHCVRCGDCCRSGGPALHKVDLALLRSGVLAASDLVTFRAGEPVRDQPSGVLVPLEAEIVKIRGKDNGWTCSFFRDESGCAIYENRPAECRALKCWDTAELAAMYEHERVTRADILGPGAMDIVTEHETRCPVPKAVELARFGGGMKLDAMYGYDEAMRETLAHRGATGGELEFLLGRPLRLVVERVLAAGRSNSR